MSKHALFCSLSLLALVAAGCGSSHAGNGASGVAATVNGKGIPVANYNEQVVFLRQQALHSNQGIDPCSVKNYAAFCKQLKQSALNTLIQQELVNQYARKHHVVVSNADFGRQWTQIVRSRFRGDQAALKGYARGLGVTVVQLRQLARDNMLQQAVMLQVTKQMSHYTPMTRLSRLDASNAKDVKTIRALLKSGHGFDQLAELLTRKTNGPCQQRKCGDLGWFPNAFIPKAQHAITTAAPGRVTGPFAGQAGFTLILVKAHDAHHRLNSTQELAMRQRLFGRWLAQQAQHASVHRYAVT